ncbi:hypothetical protein Q9295_07340 [Xinfangfangia sp. CPCC 101601]|uniref:Uncharacterized protein n=1 Tax=Pseudogemmobacter lacusdianii TaxID=3069608 RepID=A0ABU0VZ49_9RHOB|nr:hypothetical protein [Xinfangfangia sp. CPCC 101601]MDQ2066180.1 hypothetical protein [Xinfangfangia sp. CPCC 101601]
MSALLLIAGIAAVFIYQWFSKRGSTLTRACRWRMDRSVAPDFWRCAACGAETRGDEPRACMAQE